MVDLFADAINTIKVSGNAGIGKCTIANTKLLKALVEILKKNDYIKNYEEIKDGKFTRLRIDLGNKINNIGVIKPRYAVSVSDIQKYETRYIPSKDFGILILTTSGGVITNKDARSMHVGGRLLAYVY
ncbi:MAG: 30S ribosomal protein S8 [Candidatus Micrarchaeia archaeon]